VDRLTKNDGDDRRDGPMTVLAGKVVLITGVPKGCGRVLAEAFTAEGARIVGCDVDRAGGNETLSAVRDGDMIWRFLDSQHIEPGQLVSMFPIGRMGRPEELVAAVRYLCSDDARYMTGTMLVLDGGYTAQ
jgi:NAD(P)-dependent dehydrogenase (short-subunit alcohol dehydrogenase family)